MTNLRGSTNKVVEMSAANKKKSQKLTQYNEETLNYMLDVIKDHINKGRNQAVEQQ